MGRIKESEKVEIKRLAEEGKSINKIYKQLNLPKSTVYYWFKKFVGKKMKQVQINGQDKEKIGEIVGLFAGDGSFCLNSNYHYHVSFHLSINEEEYARHITNLFKNTFNKEPYFYKRRKYSKIILRYSSKKIYQFIKKYLYWKERGKTYTVKLKNLDEEKDFLLGFLRGLFDSDGYTSKYRKIVFTTVSPGLGSQISELLEKFGIENKLSVQKDSRPNCVATYRVYAYGEMADKFIDLIKPSNPQRIRKWCGWGEIPRKKYTECTSKQF